MDSETSIYRYGERRRTDLLLAIEVTEFDHLFSPEFLTLGSLLSALCGTLIRDLPLPLLSPTTTAAGLLCRDDSTTIHQSFI